jgi:hypothetical protein
MNVALKISQFTVTIWFWPRMLNWIKLRRLEFYGKQFEEINAISVGQKDIRSGRMREMNFEVV